MKPTWARGNIRLYLADMLDVLPTLENVSAVITDPPWGLAENAGRRLDDNNGKGHVGGGSKKQDTSWDSQPLSRKQWRAIKGKASKHVVWGWRYLADILGKPGSVLAWDKKRKNGWLDSFSDGEFAYCSRVQPDRFYRQRWMGACREGENEPKIHPTQKPVGLMEWCIEMVDANGTVLDPFMGSGSTGIACIHKGLPFVGIERDPVAFWDAVARIEKEIES